MTKTLLTSFLIAFSFFCLTAQEKLSSSTLWSGKVLLTPDAKEFYITTDGNAKNSGTKESPWDLESVTTGKQKIPPGSIVWVMGGNYKLPSAVKLSGTEGKPIHLRAYPGERASIDGGLKQVSASYLWIWDLEMTSFKSDWRPEKAIGKTDSYKQMPGAKGPMEVSGGKGSKFINLVIHNNIMGIGYWKNVADSELHGCIIYNNGLPGTDRPHGPGIYTQNMTKTPRLITDNIVAGNFSTGMQMYGSKMDLMVNDFLVEGNVWFAPRKEAGGRNYILCGGGKSKNIAIKNNLVYGYSLNIGSGANQVSEGNTVIHASLGGPTRDKNRVLKSGKDNEVILRPNKYDPRRANLTIINWQKADTVHADLSAFLKKGNKFKVFNALDFFGKPLAEGEYGGESIKLPIPEIPWTLNSGTAKELGVYIILKEK